MLFSMLVVPTCYCISVPLMFGHCVMSHVVLCVL